MTEYSIQLFEIIPLTKNTAYLLILMIFGMIIFCLIKSKKRSHEKNSKFVISRGVRSVYGKSGQRKEQGERNKRMKERIINFYEQDSESSEDSEREQDID